MHVHLFITFVLNDFFYILGSFWTIPDEHDEDYQQINPKLTVLCKAINVLEMFPEVAKSVWLMVQKLILFSLQNIYESI